MQDILLEPYGGKILHLPVSATTALTAMLALGGGGGLTLAARRLNLGADPHRVAGSGVLVGIVAFCMRHLLGAARTRGCCSRLGVALIGFGGGLFAHGTLTASMAFAKPGTGAWPLAPGARRNRQPPASRSRSAASSTISVRRLLHAAPSETRSRTR